jgi:hypothetical protein
METAFKKSRLIIEDLFSRKSHCIGSFAKKAKIVM